MKLKNLSAGITPLVVAALLFPSSRAEAYTNTKKDIRPLAEKELSCTADYQESLTDNLLYVYKTQQALTDKDIRLLVTFVPGKTRLIPGGFKMNAQPSCHANVYATLGA